MAEETPKKPESKPESKPSQKAGVKADAADATCRVAKCKQAVRAKGYCRKHFLGWRRGAIGEHHRYKICSKEACRKPRAHGGLCDEHANTAAKPEGGGGAAA
jgi:hypothetical protein